MLLLHAYKQVDFEKAAAAAAQGDRYDRDLLDLPVLSVGQVGHVQDDKTGQWQALATVLDTRPDGLSYIIDSGGLEQLRSLHMLRPEPVSATVGENESERDGPNIQESERDGLKVGVIPASASIMRRSQHLLEKNSEGNRLIPASVCAEDNSTSSEDFKTYTWRGALPSQQGISKSELLSHHIPFTSLPSPLWVSLSPSAISGCRTTGSAGNSIISSPRPSTAEWFQGRSLPAGQSRCVGNTRMSTRTTYRQPWQVQGVSYPKLRLGRCLDCQFPHPAKSCPSGNPCSCRGTGPWHPAAISQLGCPLVVCRGAGLPVPSPTRHALPFPVTGIG